MNKKTVLLSYFIPAIMLFFFIRNIVLVQTEQMDSWMGGGMRMFGKIDKMLYRVSGFNIEHNNKMYFVNLRSIEDFEDEDVELRILPSHDRLVAILEKIKAHSWCYDVETDQVIQKCSTCNTAIATKSIKSIEVYKVAYNPEKKTVKLELIDDAKKL